MLFNKSQQIYVIQYGSFPLNPWTFVAAPVVEISVCGVIYCMTFTFGAGTILNVMRYIAGSFIYYKMILLFVMIIYSILIEA